jgi:hypothetical protein
MGAIRFGVPRELVLWLRDVFKIDVFVETGTNRAETAVWASAHFAHVFTIEANEGLHQRAIETFGDRKNIQFLKGDSRVHIKSLLASLTEPAIFWLDAHWCGEDTFGKTEECPVVGELELLNTSEVNHIVLIDDARLFLAPPPPPHEPNHWPDIATICGLLSTRATSRYVVVHDDVIIAVPDVVKNLFMEFIRREAPRDVLQPPSAPVRRSPLAWTRSIIKRRLQ